MTEDKIAYIKYHGKKTKHGVIDLTSAAHALSGLSDIIRFFNSKQNAFFSENSYEIPIKINEGSWEAAIIENPFTTAIITGASIFAGSYLKKAGEKIAENDFKDVSFKKILQRSMNALVEFIKIKKNGFNTEDLSKSKTLVRNGIIYVLITLPNGTQIEVENEFLEWYKKMPPTMLQKVVHVVEQERRLEVAVFNDGEIYKETINENEK